MISMLDMMIKSEDMNLNRLYKYRPFNKNTLKLILEGELFFSKPKDFNDPFDSYIDEIIEGTDDDFNQYLKRIMKNDQNINDIMKRIKNKEINFINFLEKNKSQNYFNIFCFSRNYNNILMWSHYADEHKGICIGFNISHVDENSLTLKCKENYIDINKTKGFNNLPVFHVVYSKERPVPYNIIKSKHQELRDFIYSKSIDWKYEEEYRIVLQDDVLLSNPVKIELNEIKEIIFGLRMDDKEKIMLKKLIKSNIDDIDIYEMVKTNRSYEIVRERIC